MMGSVAAQALGKDNAHRFGQYEALGQVEVLAHARSVDLQAIGNDLRLTQGTGYQTADLRQGLPLGMPQPQATFVFLRHGAQQGRDQARHPRCRTDEYCGAHRITLVRHGRGTAFARRRRLEHFRRFSLHQQTDVTTQLAQAAGNQTEYRSELHQTVALGVPRLLRQLQVQLFGQGLRHRQRFIAERRQGPGCTAELQG
ncbi:hypothetical protein D3C78_651130 [compost metagenome]